MNLGQALIGLLVFPGLLYAVPMAWLMLWVERKAIARMQARIGPPFYQPFFDFMKLAAKRVRPMPGLEGWLIGGLPLVAFGAVLGALALLPVFPTPGGWTGDVILLVTLLEVPPICAVLAGFASRSVFGQVGATREAVLAMAYNLPFLTAVVAFASAAGSLRLSDIAFAPPAVVRILALFALVICLPVKLRLNPFSLVNAEQEIYTGPTTEFGGVWLALWELAHGLEWVALTGLVVVVLVPVRSGIGLVDGAVFAFVSLVVVLALTALAASMARIKVPQASRFYWRWGMGLSLLALVVANIPLFR